MFVLIQSTLSEPDVVIRILVTKQCFSPNGGTTFPCREAF
jgi:hypothetical protein